jgi:hypothetical protein
VAFVAGYDDFRLPRRGGPSWTTEREGVALRCGFLLLSGLAVGFYVVLWASSSTWFVVVPRRVLFYRREEMFHVPDLSFLSEGIPSPMPTAQSRSLSSLFLLILPFSKP